MQKNTPKHRKSSSATTNRLTGIISTTAKGTGFVAHDEHEEDVVIEPGFLNTALNGDEVEIILQPKVKGERQTGEVIKIIHRAKMSFVGAISQSNGVLILDPDDKKMYADIFISKENAKNATLGDKALVRITGWDEKKRTPQGEVVRVLGKKGQHEVEMQSIILEKNIDTDFPPEVEREAEEIGIHGKPLPEDEIQKRRDFRTTATLTIDPLTAKDFDDAISFKALDNGNVEVGIHIADVSYYVREGTELDKEARKRATSVYLVDRTIPMLPEVLSNDLCSLNPNEDRFAFSAVFVLTANGHVKERWFGRTVIHSDRRFTYEDAQAIIDAGDGEYASELSTLNSIAKKLREEKALAGAIDFEQDEVRFELDAEGKPIRVYKKERLDTHKLVEEYMLLANREVAEFIYKSEPKDGNKHPISLYRIHDVPDKERLENLSIYLKALGYEFDIKGSVTSKDLNEMLSQVSGKDEEALIKTATIRTMAKAVYSTKNIGHFGLAFKFYTHFTSPIRRYPDLVVHRVLDGILTGNKKRAQDEFSVFERIAAHSSAKEIEAADAERTSIKYKQVEFMSDKVGQEFDATISGVTEWGVYVEEVETRAEGMVRLRDMSDDYYELDKKTYSIKGTRSGKKLTLGDKVRVKLTGADLDSKTLDFKFV